MTSPSPRRRVTLSVISDRILGAELTIGGRQRRSESRFALLDGTPSSHDDTQPSFLGDESQPTVLDETVTQTSHTGQTSADNSPTVHRSARQIDGVDDTQTAAHSESFKPISEPGNRSKCAVVPLSSSRCEVELSVVLDGASEMDLVIVGSKRKCKSYPISAIRDDIRSSFDEPTLHDAPTVQCTENEATNAALPGPAEIGTSSEKCPTTDHDDIQIKDSTRNNGQTVPRNKSFNQFSAPLLGSDGRYKVKPARVVLQRENPAAIAEKAGLYLRKNRPTRCGRQTPTNSPPSGSKKTEIKEEKRTHSAKASVKTVMPPVASTRDVPENRQKVRFESGARTSARSTTTKPKKPAKSGAQHTFKPPFTFDYARREAELAQKSRAHRRGVDADGSIWELVCFEDHEARAFPQSSKKKRGGAVNRQKPATPQLVYHGMDEEDGATAGPSSRLNESYSFDEFVRDQNLSSDHQLFSAFDQSGSAIKMDLDFNESHNDFFSCDSSVEFLKAEWQNMSRDLSATLLADNPRHPFDRGSDNSLVPPERSPSLSFTTGFTRYEVADTLGVVATPASRPDPGEFVWIYA